MRSLLGFAPKSPCHDPPDLNPMRRLWPVFRSRPDQKATSARSGNRVAPSPLAIETAWHLGGQLPPLGFEHWPVAVLYPGDQRAVRLGQGMDFELLRTYQPGEPAHLIDWRISARTSEPVVRIFREPAQRQCHIVLDTSDSMFFGTRCQLKITQALTLAHLLTASALHQNLSVTIHTPGLPLRTTRHPGTSRAALLDQLDEIGLWLEPPAEPQPIDWNGFRGRLQGCLSDGQLVIVLGDFQTDFAEDPSMMGWLPLAQKHRLMMLSISDPAERKLPDMGRVTFAVKPANSPRRINTHDAAVRAELAKRFSERQQAIRALCLAVGGLFDEVDTRTDVPELANGLSELLLTGQGHDAAEAANKAVSGQGHEA